MLRKLSALIFLLFLYITGFSGSFYLSCNQVFSDDQDAVAQLYNYNYYYQYNKGNRSSDVDFILYRLPSAAAYFNLRSSGRITTAINDSTLKFLPIEKKWEQDFSDANYYTQNVNMGKLPEGVYILEAMIRGEISHIPIVVSNWGIITRTVNNHIVTYVTNKKTGEAITDFQAMAILGDSIYKPIAYRKGVAVFNPKLPTNTYNASLPIMALKDNKLIVNSVYLYSYYYNSPATEKIYLFTDQSAYRPEKWVRFKGIARILSGSGFELSNPAGKTVYYSLYNPQNQQISRHSAVLDKNGCFVDSVFIDKDKPLGSYNIRARISHEFAQNEYYYPYGNYKENTTSFSIEEFKKPEFEVLVKPGQSQYSSGDLVSAEISGKYFFGSPLTNAEVNWKVVREVVYRPWYYGYRYSWWYDDYYTAYSSATEVVHSGTGKLNSDGKLLISFPTSKDKKENFKYTIIADMMDASRRTISGSSQLNVTATEFMLSATSRYYYYEPNDLVTLDVSATDFDQNPIATTVKVKVFNGSYKANSAIDYTPVHEFNYELKAEQESNQIHFTAENSGYYKVVLETTDKHQNTVSTECYAYVINPSDIGYRWWQNAGGQTQIITNKKVYEAGESIEAMIYVPHSTEALVTLNGQSFSYYNVIDFKQRNQTDTTGTFRKITIPTNSNVFGKLELGLAYYKNNQFFNKMEPITIIPSQQYLNVSISYDREKYKPGDLAEALVTVTNREGDPVPNANLSFGITDESIYSMYPESNTSIQQTFYNQKTKYYSYYYGQTWNVYDYSATASPMQFHWRQKNGAINLMRTDLLNQSEYARGFTYEKTDKNSYISGYVFNYANGQAVADAGFMFNGKMYNTDAQGFFLVPMNDTSKINIRFSKGENAITLTNVRLHKDRNLCLYVSLSPKSQKLDMAQLLYEYFNGNNLDEQSQILGEEVTASAGISMSDNLGMTSNLESVTVSSKSLARFEEKNESDDYEGKKLAPATAMYKTMDQLDLNDWMNRAGGPGFTEAVVRSDFKDNLLWLPNLNTDGWGKAKITIKIPDNLTTWRNNVKVITSDNKVGETMARFTVSKNLLVRMETPRFMTLGDQLLIATNVHNYLSTDKLVKVSLLADGIELPQTSQMMMVPAGGEKRIDWKIDVEQLRFVKLTVKAQTNEESDAMESSIPVLPLGLVMVQAFSSTAVNTQKSGFRFTIDQKVDLSSVKLELSSSSSITSSLLAGMDQLIGYPYGCVEQTMSRFLPTVIVSNTLKTLGSDYNSGISQDELTKMVAQGSKRLKELQHNDGGWGWWENDNTHPFMTAYAINGLYLASQNGYAIEENMLSSGKSALSNLIQNKTADNTTSAAYMQLVAQRMGMKNLWPAKLPDLKNANAYEVALWLQAACLVKDNTAKIELLDRLKGMAITEGNSVHWGGKKFYYSWTDDEVETTANAVQALLMAEPSCQLIPSSVQWLMSQKTGNAWNNTRQTAMCIYALNDLIKGELNPSLEYQIYCNGSLINTRKISGENNRTKGFHATLTAEQVLAATDEIATDANAILKHGENTVEIRQTGNGYTYLNAKLVYYKKGGEINAEERKALPFQVKREYYKLEKKTAASGTVNYKKTSITEDNIHPGDDIFVKVSVVTTSAHQFVLMEDPIPAGCEFVRNTKGYLIEGESLDNLDPATKYYWYNWNQWYTHREFRDSHLAMTITNLNAGTYSYNYILKAQIPGSYQVNPAISMLMYYPETRGFSDFGKLTITEKAELR